MGKTNQKVIITKDEDFVILHNADESPCALCWIRVGNTRKKDLLAWFERLLPSIEEKLASSEFSYKQPCFSFTSSACWFSTPTIKPTRKVHECRVESPISNPAF